MNEELQIRSLVFEAQSESQTDWLGAAVAQCLISGLVVALTGNLGAGKTRFVQAVAAGLGVTRSDVTSPTFVLIQEYAGRLRLYHFDTYRLRDIDEFMELGADELLHGDGVCFIEWADRVAEVLPKDRLTILIETSGETQRTFRISSSGPKSSGVFDCVSKSIG